MGLPIQGGKVMEKDLFGFADAINLDHLNLEQLKELEKLLEKIK
jgi:hypothetical protein